MARPGGALVSWHAPATGAPILAYVIKATPGGKTVRTGNATKFVVGGLTNGKAYRFSVAAVNAAGTGSFSALSKAVTPKPNGKPGIVKGIVATAGFQQIAVRWLAPTTGGAPIIGYRIKVTPGGKIVNVPGQTRSTTVIGLKNGTKYVVTVAAVNKVGIGPAGASKRVTTHKTAPTAPTLVQAAPTGSGVKLAWQPPAESGGSPITAYVVTGAGRKITTKSTQRSLTIAGLTAGKLYSFTVAAKNAIGTSAAVKSPEATPDAGLQPNAVVLSAQSLATLGQVLSDGTLQFVNPPAQVTGLQPGDVVVIGVTAATPEGMMAQVRYVSGDASLFSVGTRPAALDQVFTKGGFGASGTLSEGQLASFQSARQGVQLERKRVGLPGLSVSVNTQLYKDSRGRSVTVKGNVSVNPAVDFSAHLTCCIHVDSHFKGTVTTSSSLKFSADYDYSIREKRVVLGTYRFNPIFLSVAGVPIVLFPSLTLSLGAKGQVSAGLTAEAGQTATLGADVRTHDGQVTAAPISNYSAYYQLPTPYGEVSVSAGPVAELNVNINGLPGPSLTDNLWLLSLTANPVAHPCWTLSVQNVLALEYKLDILNRNLVDYRKELLNYKKLLAQHADPCLTVTVEPKDPKIKPGETVQFKATVLGAQSPNVNWSVPAGGGSITSTGKYTAPSTPGIYQVTALSPALGLKPEAKGTTSVQVGDQPPDPPTSVIATAGGKGEAKVQWQPPVSTGGAPILDYQVTASPGGKTVTSASTSAQFTGLTPKVTYTFTVKARSSAGTSLPSSPSNPVRISDGSDIQVGQGNIEIKLIWDDDNDEDLHVTEPSGTEIWYQAKGPTATGGLLDRDDNVAMCGNDPVPGGVENVYWPDGTTPAAGTYKVEIVQFKSCGGASNWTAEVRIGNRLIKRQSGVGVGTFTFDYPAS